jgi:GxxExxY protein
MAPEEPFVDEVDEPDPELNRVTNSIIGAAIEVHRELGPGYLESNYENAMEIEFRRRGISFARQVDVFVMYKGQQVGKGTIDFIVEGKVLVELKAVDALAPVHTAQVIAYLKATGLRLGLLLNFNVRVLREGIKRIAR